MHLGCRLLGLPLWARWLRWLCTCGKPESLLSFRNSAESPLLLSAGRSLPPVSPESKSSCCASSLVPSSEVSTHVSCSAWHKELDETPMGPTSANFWKFLNGDLMWFAVTFSHIVISLEFDSEIVKVIQGSNAWDFTWEALSAYLFSQPYDANRCNFASCKPLIIGTVSWRAWDLTAEPGMQCPGHSEHPWVDSPGSWKFQCAIDPRWLQYTTIYCNHNQNWSLQLLSFSTNCQHLVRVCVLCL